MKARTIQDDFAEAVAKVRQHLAEIEDGVRLIEGNAIHGPMTWTTVGEVNRLKSELRAIADRLVERGEYA